MKRFSVSLAAAALLLAGCTAGTDGSSGADESTESGNEVAAQTAPTSTADGFMKKQVGELAGSSCDGENFEDCDVVFSVTELQRGYECSDGSTLLAGGDVNEGYEPVLIRVEAEMADSFAVEHSDNALHMQHWGVIDNDGYYIQSPDSMYCPDLDFDLGRLYPGTKARGAILLAVPEGAETIRLGQLSGSGGWEWEIPS